MNERVVRQTSFCTYHFKIGFFFNLYWYYSGLGFSELFLARHPLCHATAGVTLETRCRRTDDPHQDEGHDPHTEEVFRPTAGGLIHHHNTGNDR